MVMGKRSFESMSASEGRSPSSELLLQQQTPASTGSTFEADHLAKIPAIDPSGWKNKESTVMQCRLPPHSHPVDFTCLEDFEVHYTQEHTNRCLSCGKNLPSTHFLHLHLDEVHNPVREALAAKGEKTFSCLVVGCDKKCTNPSKRRLHLIDKHGFPKLYNFRIIEYGIDHTTSLLREGRRRRVSTTVDPPSRHPPRFSRTQKPDSEYVTSEAEVLDDEGPHAVTRAHLGLSMRPRPLVASNKTREARPNEDITDLETTFAALNFVPRSVLSRRHVKDGKN